MNLYPLSKEYKLKLSKNLGLTLDEMNRLSLGEIENHIIRLKKIKEIKPLLPKNPWLNGRGSVFIYLGELLTESWLVRQIAKL